MEYEKWNEYEKWWKISWSARAKLNVESNILLLRHRGKLQTIEAHRYTSVHVRPLIVFY